jgi:N-acetylglucosamine malate deacetylase 1
MRNPRTRRSFLKASTLLAVPFSLNSASVLRAADQAPSGGKLKVVCIGGHPDDPESGCSGTLIRYAQQGHSVTIIYLTRGERGIRNKSIDEAAKIRTTECEAACRIIGARPVFFGQIDGSTEFTQPHVTAMTKLLSAEQPDILFTQWPIDTHMDHQVASMLAIRAHMALGQRAQLYFFEVNAGSQTQGFLPTTYVDISGVVEKKKEALFAHESQDGRAIWRDHHEPMARWRGREAGVTAAEAFVHLNHGLKTSKLPGL